MRRFISKIDHDMYVLLNLDKEKAMTLWHKIKDKKHLLKHALEVTKDKSGKRYLFGPAICHMILSNPSDVDAELYDSLVSMVLRDTYYSRLTVADNLSFASLILMNGNQDLSILNSNNLIREIRNKAYMKPYLQNQVNYADILLNEKNVDSIYKDDSLDLKLNRSEVRTYLSREHIIVTEQINFEEIDELMRYAMESEDLDLRFKTLIHEIYIDSQSYRVDNDQTYGLEEETPKL